MGEIKTQKCEDLIYDVGMHKGEDTAYYLKKGFRVIGFEADPDLIGYCRIKFAEEINKERLIIINGAIVDLELFSEEIKFVKFYKNKKQSVWGTVFENWAKRNELLGTSIDVIEVPVVNFSECILKYGIPYYMKIDIEGMDTVCLKTLNCFEKRPNYISIESEKSLYEKLIDELNLFKQLGYNKFQAIQQNVISNQIEPNPANEGLYIGYKFIEGSSGLFGKELPNKWKNFRRILIEYKFIFFIYKLFGDYGTLNNYYVGKIIKKVLKRLLGRPIPGWYDTHAKHSSNIQK